MSDELFSLLADRTENRTAFIAALIVERCHKTGPLFDDLEDGNKVARFNPYQAARIASELVSLAGTIKRCAEIECSREMSPSEIRSAERAQAKFLRMAELMGLEGRAGGDPRGACAYLIDPANPKDGDGWGNGWAVYR